MRTVYISYSTPEEQVIALRLQALGTASGLAVFIPAVFTRMPGYQTLGVDTSFQLDYAQLVVAIALTDIRAAFMHDVERARLLGRPTVIFASCTTQGALRASYPFANIVAVDAQNPIGLDVQINNALGLQAPGGEKALLFGFIMVAVGLILLDGATPRLPR